MRYEGHELEWDGRVDYPIPSDCQVHREIAELRGGGGRGGWGGLEQGGNVRFLGSREGEGRGGTE